MKYKISLRKRRMAIFLLITFLQSIVLPPVASALTSGPTAPETMSFEPVDATDMVSLMTGDFTYNIPLLEVPSPEGGYPLSLSYHAGIKPLEDASWVGLGWNLSPGAINRAVNGYPDDHKDVERSVEDYWEGGSTSTYSVGIGFGIPAGPHLGLDISVSNDTYQGFGGDVGLSVGVGQKYGPNASIRASLGTSGFSLGANIGFATKYGIGLSVGGSTNFNRGSAASFSVSHGASRSSVGFSMSSSGTKPSLKAGGLTAYQHNNNSGNISTRSWGIGFSFVISLGYRHTRYWMHETDDVITNGTLYASNSNPGALVNKVIQDEHVNFDSYSLHQTDINIAEHSDPEWVQGGSYPAYDNYSVSGQGIGGNIQPYIFDNGSLYRKQIRKVVDNEELLDLTFYHMRSFYNDVNFRFVNDFSNSLQVVTPPLNLDVNNPSTSFQFYSTLHPEGYESTDQHLAGSKHIEWYTNQQILDGAAPTLAKYPGLTTAQRTTHSSTDDLLDQMGGVSITNESGVTYHYALPVYTYGEYTYTKKINNQNGDSWNKQLNNEPYAYTWLLTAVTGSDYVDKNNNKKVDDEDWGYWVEFEYGEWVHDYAWRSPATGTFRDINEKSDTYSHGYKSIYYLDAIKTRSHTALFVKDIRKDGKSVTNKYTGGFEPKNGVLCSQNGFPNQIFAAVHLPISQMRLDKVLLFNNSSLEENNVNLNTVRQHGTLPGDQVGYSSPCSSSTINKTFHYSDNVIDVSDMSQSAMSAVMGDALKTIELDNDHYDLCPETDNSFEELTGLYNQFPETGGKTGKLTLQSVKYKGLNNSTVMPPLNFKYDYDNPSTHNYNYTASSISGSSIWIAGASPDWVGDVVKYTYGGEDYYLLLTKFFGASNFNTIQLGDNTPLSSHSGAGGHTLVRTKNAPFNDNKYDYWGYYKSDFTYDSKISPSHISRLPTTTSVKNTDAWSLRSIETSLGATIEMEYENKHYEDNVWQKYDQINYNQATMNSNNTEITLAFNEDIDIEDAFTPGDMIIMTGFYTIPGAPLNSLHLFDEEEVEVIAVSPTTLRVENPLASGQNIAKFGFLKFMRSGAAYGNGIRTTSIAVKGDGDTRKTNYDYQDGCISYNPSSLEFIKSTSNSPEVTNYEKSFKKDLSFVIALARELPAPAVMYETVSINEEYNGVSVPGSKRYTFQVPEKDMITVDYSPIQYVNTNGYPDVEELSKRIVTIKDKTAQVGNLLKVELINGQGLVSSKTSYDYTDDEPDEDESDYDQFADQGIIHQAFHELRTKYSGNEDFRFIKGVVSKREEFPSILKSTTNTSQGFTTVTKNVAYDFYSGQLIQSETENQKGEFYRSESIPAYKKYEDMGLKIHDVNKHHMLSQSAYNETSEIDGWNGNVIGILNAEAITWNDNWAYRQPYATAYADVPATANKEKVWRKHKQFVWKSDTNPDGSISSSPNTSDQDINWSTGIPSTTNWETATTVTRYDKYSKVLEERDLDDNYASLKMGYDDAYILATNGNARYSEFAFSSAEDYDSSTGYFGGEVRKGSGSVSSFPAGQNISHTGQHHLGLNNGEEGFLFKTQIGTDVEQFSTRGRRYRASVWWLPNGPGIDLDQGRLFYRIVTVSGSVLYSGEEVLTPDYDRKAGYWHQLNLDIEIPSGYNNHYLEVGVRNDNSSAYELYFDDFRFYPTDAPFKAYVYDKLTGELTFILDENNMFTQFEYNDKGQLIKTYVETTENPKGKRLVTESDYHYKRPLD